MRPRLLRAPAVALALALVTAGCSGGGETESATPPGEPPSSTTTAPAEPPTTAETTTTPPPPPATTTTAAPRPLGGGALPKAVTTSTGVTAPVLGRQGNGLLVGTPCGRSATVSLGTPIEGVVVLDAGHGGVEPGAVGPNGLEERGLNLAVTRHAQAALEANAVPVVLTRTGDYRITLEARARIVEAVKPRAFASIHFNAEPDGPREGPGAETYYQTRGASAAESKRLAGLVYEEVVKAMSGFTGIAWVADRDAGAKFRTSSSGNDYYGILRRTQGTPAVLAELGFVSNPPEADLYARPDVQRIAGEAVANGILRFLRTPDPGSGFVEPYPREQPAGGGGGADNCEDPAL